MRAEGRFELEGGAALAGFTPQQQVREAGVPSDLARPSIWAHRAENRFHGLGSYRHA